ncbi:Dihydroxyacetone kinase 2 [Umbelopsis sp. WA50703]
MRLLENEKGTIVYNANIEEIAKKQVTIIAGGGAGHEPSHAAFVGENMLTGAVSGQVFASPSAGQILAALRKVRSPHGTLVVIKNYTGDCLHFGLAVERAKAEGMNIEMVVVGDDVAVGREKGGMVGRRGLAATVLVHKVAGAVAAQGATLAEVRDAAQYVIDNSATCSVSLDHCHVPGSSSFASLGVDEMEWGTGIHNEPGAKKTEIKDVKTIVHELLFTILDEDDKDRAYLKLNKTNEKVVLLVNNLGGISILELGVVAKEAAEYLAENGIEVERIISGTFMSSLNMPGASLTLLKVPKNGDKLDFSSLLDLKVGAPGWVNNSVRGTSLDVVDKTDGLSDMSVELSNKTAGKITNKEAVVQALRSGAESVIAAEPDITHYDTILGDGDCGQTLKEGSNALLAALSSIDLSTAPAAILAISDILDTNMGGTSAAIYCIFLNAFAIGLVDASSKTADQAASTISVWSDALKQALDSLLKYTPAREGDRTMMDVLIPFVNTLHQTQSLDQAVDAAKNGAEKTKTMHAKLGRASYVNDESVMSAAVPDAGAWGLLALLTGIQKGLAQ